MTLQFYASILFSIKYSISVYPLWLPIKILESGIWNLKQNLKLLKYKHTLHTHINLIKINNISTK